MNRYEDSNMSESEGASCDRHGWHSTNPMANCKGCLKEDNERQSMQEQIFELSAENADLRSALSGAKLLIEQLMKEALKNGPTQAKPE